MRHSSSGKTRLRSAFWRGERTGSAESGVDIVLEEYSGKSLNSSDGHDQSVSALFLSKGTNEICKKSKRALCQLENPSRKKSVRV